MNYIDTIEQQLRNLVKETSPEELSDELVSYVKEKILESFRNGIETAKNKARFPKDRQKKVDSKSKE